MSHHFVHLHNHSEYSILDGAVRLEDLTKTAAQLNMGAVALTDHGNVFGAVDFFRKAKEAGIKPILGCEAYVAPRSRFEREVRNQESAHFHLLLLVRNEKGYRNLCALITQSYLEGFYYRPRMDKELLARHSEGLIALSACLKGEVAFLLGREMEEAAERAASEYRDIFGPGNFYIELMDHGLEPQKTVNPKLVRLARRLDLPLAATNDVHFLAREDAESHDALLCIQTNKKVSETDRIRFGSQEFYFKSGEEMERLFGEIPEALENTFHIASQCDFQFPTGTYFLPNFSPPDGKNVQEYFKEIARDGFEERLRAMAPKWERGELRHRPEEYRERLERELRIIEDMKFEGYFLIVWDLLRTARAKDIPVGPGRGSAAGSLLAYSLRITDIDPLEYDLLFERFLNPERISLPDIDMDFCARRREEMIRYVTERYGRDNVCQIITFGTMAARAAIRDVGRVLEVPLPEVDRISKMIPVQPGQDVTIADAIKDVPALKELRDKNDKIAHLLAVAQKVEGQVRHPSIHAAGIVITPRPLVEFVPLYKSSKDEITTQFAMGDIEAIGLLKMDLLGLRNLTVIRDAQDLIEKDCGVRVDVDALPLDDAAVFALFQAGATDGVFQFESRGMKELLRNYGPEEFRDLIALCAFYRPGPLKSGMTAEFIRRKHHPEEIVYDIPLLEPILQETRGLIVYQEQVMRIATELAGFSLGQADVLRKAMGKKKAGMFESQKERFLAGVKKKGVVGVGPATRLFETIGKFAEYGFNKSHSAAYAAVAYQTAYLKAHYPRQYMAALLTSEAERGATPQVVKYINACKEMGIVVRPPDIRESEFHFVVQGDDIRFGLAAVKNVGETAVREILKARDEHGPFRSPFDVVRETDSRVINRKVLENLIKAGAFDGFGLARSQCFHLVDALIEYNHDIQKARASRQSMLFGDGGAEPPPMPDEIRTMSEWNELLKLSYEKDAVGFYLTGHPLAQYEKRLRALASHFVADLDDARDANAEVVLAGIVQVFKPLKTKKDERMGSFFLEDLTGRLEVLVFPETFRKFGEFVREDQKVWIKGKYVVDSENRKLQMSAAVPLDEALQKMAKKVTLRVFMPGLEMSLLDDVLAVLERHPGDCPVVFELETPLSYRLTVQAPEYKTVAPTEAMAKDVETILGENAVFIEY